MEAGPSGIYGRRGGGGVGSGLGLALPMALTMPSGMGMGGDGSGLDIGVGVADRAGSSWTHGGNGIGDCVRDGTVLASMGGIIPPAPPQSVQQPPQQQQQEQPPAPFRFNLTLPTASQRSQAQADGRSQPQVQQHALPGSQPRQQPTQETRTFVQPGMGSTGEASNWVRPPALPQVSQNAGVSGSTSTSTFIPPTPSSCVRRVRPPIPLSISFPPALPIALIPTLSGLAAEGLGMAAYHTSVSSQLRTQLAAQLSQYQRYKRPAVEIGRSPASTSAVPLVAGASSTTNPPSRPARQQVDLAGLAARDREHSNAWVLEGYKRYTSALKPEEFMLDVRGAGMGMGGALGKRRRRRYTDGEGLAIGMKGGSELGMEGVEGSAVILEEGDADGAREPDRKRPRVGRSPVSAGSATFADQVLGRRSFSAHAELSSPSREAVTRIAPPAAPVPTSFADAVAAMNSSTVLFPVLPSVMTHGSTPGLTSEGFTSIGGLVGMEASSFEGIQTPPPAPMHPEHGATNVKAPSKAHVRPTFTLSSDKLAITPVSPPRNRDKRPSLTTGRKPSSTFITPARRTSLHNQHGAGSASNASGQASRSAGHETSSSSSLASLTSASLSCSQADMSPRTPAALLHNTLATDDVTAGARSGDAHAIHHHGEGSLGGLSTANVAKHNGTKLQENRGELASGVQSEEDGRGTHSRRKGGGGGADDDFWAELSEFGTPS